MRGALTGVLRILAVLAAVIAALCVPAAAAPVEVDLKLVLAVDVSFSMDTGEQAVQRQGYVEALRHPQVIAAIASGVLGRIAVTYVEWGGSDSQVVRVPWTVIDGKASAEKLAELLNAASYENLHRTSISAALLFAATSLDTPDFAAPRRVIDISGDGPNNQGLPVTAVRDAVVAEGVIINGLPIMTNPLNFDGFFDIPNVDEYYEDCVIGGTGAFIIPITDTKQFAEAIRRKLVLEISARPALIRPVADIVKSPRVDCLIGEKMWRSWRDNLDQ